MRDEVTKLRTYDVMISYMDGVQLKHKTIEITCSDPVRDIWMNPKYNNVVRVSERR